MRTHCRKGHDLMSDENVYFEKKTGYRRCRLCRGAEASTWQKEDYKENPQKYLDRGKIQDQKPSMKEYRKDLYERTKNSVWRRYSVRKSAAKLAGREFTITQEEYRTLVEPNKCHYCDGPLPKAGSGIDRQNNDLGYVLENVVPCCERCNEKKGSLEGLGFKYPRTVELLMELRNNENARIHSSTRDHDG